MKRKEGEKKKGFPAKILLYVLITSLLISPCPESKFLGRTLTLLRGCVSIKWTKFVCMYVQVHVVYICT